LRKGVIVSLLVTRFCMNPIESVDDDLREGYCFCGGRSTGSAKRFSSTTITRRCALPCTTANAHFNPSNCGF
ncbi:MAG: hypothetical protein RPT94_10600, partial [Candidatus Sedimenticola sp. (ex Thyasira tokunagai)]